MIDQLVSGLPQAVPAKANANANARDRQASGTDEQDGGSESFESLVSLSGKQNKGKREAGDLPERTLDENIVDIGVETARPVSYELSLTLRKQPGSVDGRLRLANTKDMVATADTARTAAMEEVSSRADEFGLPLGLNDHKRVDAKAERRTAAGKGDSEKSDVVATADTARKAAIEEASSRADRLRATVKNDVVTRDDRLEPVTEQLSPADELGLLLGLGDHKRVDAKAERRTAGGKDDSEKKDVPTAKDDVLKAEQPSTDRPLASNLVDNRQDVRADSRDDDKGAVRVVSADGRGRSVEIGLAKATSETSKEAEKPSSAPKVDTATVLEARRYLGFTPDTNATTLAHAVKADPGWTAALEVAGRLDQGTMANTLTEVNTLKLQMNPENLGNMVASLRLKGEELTVELQVSSVEAYRHLSADHDDIVRALQDQGFTIDKVTVQLNAADRMDMGADRDTSRQGQMQRDGQGAQPDSGNGRRGEWQRPGQQEIRDLVSDDGPLGTRRPGDVYL